MEEEKKKPKYFNYRKFYEKETGSKIPDGFDIHHIDCDRSNNHILNLVALPKELYREYHRQISGLSPTMPGEQNNLMFSINLQLSSGIVLDYEDMLVKQFFKAWEVVKQCSHYIYHRNSLIGFDKVMYLENHLMHIKLLNKVKE
jgi:hypothetical protein